MLSRITAFWEERKKTKLGQLHLLWILAFVMCGIAAIRSSEFSAREKIQFWLAGSALLYLGLIVCYFIPSVYLGFIRMKKKEQKPVWHHRVLFSLYVFPVIPFLFAAATAAIISTGIFD